MMTEAADMPLSGHLTELRKRLIYSFLAIAFGTAVSFFFIRELMAFLTAPAGQLYFARPTEVLMIYIKTAVVAGFVLACGLLRILAFPASCIDGSGEVLVLCLRAAFCDPLSLRTRLFLFLRHA